ncbi:MAG: TlpA family protein disulfide reductase [Anaerolineales bacterium]|nr:TlpA family protein disulfide reductase [Anaerolineales bacterium]
MTENMPEDAAPKRGVPVWAQSIIWTLLIALLVVIFMGLKRAQEGHVQEGSETSGFEFTMPLFEGYGYDGAQEISLTSLRGKIVVLNFWASWCLTCKEEAAELEEAWRYYQPGGEVVFIGVDYVDTEPEALAYLKEFDITYPNGPDMGTKISQAFRIQGVPETYFLGRDGVVQRVQIGPFSSTEQIKTIVDALLAQ